MIKRGSEMPSVLVPAVCLLENWCRTGADKVWTAKVKRGSRPAVFSEQANLWP